MSLTVTADLSVMRARLQALGAQAPLAASRALNRSISSVQTAAVRDLADDMNLTQKDVRKGMQITKATPETLRAVLKVTSKRIVLHAFAARQVAAGVTYNVGRGRGLAAGAFIATMRSGHVGVFRRAPGIIRRGPEPNRSGLPIFELFGPSLPRVFTRARIADARRALATQLMQKNLAHEVDFLVSGLRKPSLAPAGMFEED